MVQHTQPTLEQRPAQHYAGIRTSVRVQRLPRVIPQLFDEIADWLRQREIKPLDVRFIRYHAIEFSGAMDVTIGWLVDDPVSGEGDVTGGAIPAGQYTSLIYTDASRSIEGNHALLDWANEQDIDWDTWETAAGHGFRSRVEFFLDGPQDDPDPANWRVEVAIKVAGDDV